MKGTETTELLRAAGEIRQRCGISRATVARALGVDSSTVSRWEAGVRRGGMEARRYARVIAGLQRHLEITRETS